MEERDPKQNVIRSGAAIRIIPTATEEIADVEVGFK